MFTKPRRFPSTCDTLIAWEKNGLSDLKASARATAPNFAGECRIIQGEQVNQFAL